MKTAIFIENGLVQTVLTPETEDERAWIKTFDGKEYKAYVRKAEFVRTIGNFAVQRVCPESLMLILTENPFIPGCPGGSCDTV